MFLFTAIKNYSKIAIEKPYIIVSSFYHPMVVFETLASMLATTTAKSVIKFLDEKVAEYINKKFGGKPPSDIESLKKEVEELKVKLEAKESTELTETDIEEVSKAVTKVEQKQKSFSETIISDSMFREWSETKLYVEDQAPVVKRELEMLINKAKELKISERKRWDIQDMIIALDMNLNDMIEAKRRVRKFRLTSDEEKSRAAEIALRDTIFEARNFLEPYYGARIT